MLTSAELTLLAEEIADAAVPARVDKIHQPRPDTVVIRLARGGEEHALLVVASRRFARAHLVTAPPQNPKTPPVFCEDLRRLLQPGRLVGVRTLPNDAVLVLDFEVKDAPGPRRLVAELFGAHPNLLVVSHAGTIEAVLVAREARGRKLVVGERYVDPTPRARDIAKTAPFSGFGPVPAGTSLSALLEREVTPLESEALVAVVRDAFLADLGQEEKKLRRRLDNIDADIRGADAIPRLRREGELLKANLGALRRGMKEVTLSEWTGEHETRVNVALDPKRTPHEEVAFRFDEARRLERLKEAAAQRRGEVDERLAALAALATSAAAAASEDAIEELRADAGFAPRPRAGPGKKAAPTVEPRKPYRVFTSKDGIEILVGRTSADNDELTFRVANGNDFWLHVRDYPGSHVVVRERDHLPEDTLLDAATLAVHFSRGAAGGKREVSWTRRKFVSKARKAPPGQVLLSAHKSLMLRPDPERLARLLKG